VNGQSCDIYVNIYVMWFIQGSKSEAKKSFPRDSWELGSWNPSFPRLFRLGFRTLIGESNGDPSMPLDASSGFRSHYLFVVYIPVLNHSWTVQRHVVS